MCSHSPRNVSAVCFQLGLVDSTKETKNDIVISIFLCVCVYKHMLVHTRELVAMEVTG